MDNSIITYIVAPIIAFSVVIFLHEFGHFLAAKIVGVKVERFSIGFGPEIVGFTRNGTRYCISALPILGGYVQMAGDHPDKVTGAPWEFYSASIKKRFFIIIAGPFANFISAIFIYALGFMIGIEVPKLPNQVGKIEKDTPAYEAGIKFKDRIIEINAQSVDDWNDIQEIMFKIKSDDKVVNIIVLRNNKEIKLQVKLPAKEELTKTSELTSDILGLKPYIYPKVIEVIKGYPAERAGIRPGDVITKINGKRIDEWDDLTEIIHTSINKPLKFSILREDKIIQLEITPIAGKIAKEGGIVEIGQIGIRPETGKIELQRLGPIEALIEGFLRTVIGTPQYIILIIQGFVKNLISIKDLSGPVGIFCIAGEQGKSGIGHLLLFIGFLSVNLWFFNLLPFPVLDGGHLIFLGIEKLSNRRIAWKIQGISNIVGITLLILLLLIVTYHDILRYFGTALDKIGFSR
jgi:regulator of sigma E protease